MSKKLEFNFEPFTDEELKEMTSDQLYMNIVKFKRLIKEARKVGKETTPFEVELCYLDNEKQFRSRFEKISRSRR